MKKRALYNATTAQNEFQCIYLQNEKKFKRNPNCVNQSLNTKTPTYANTPTIRLKRCKYKKIAIKLAFLITTPRIRKNEATNCIEAQPMVVAITVTFVLWLLSS